MILDQATIAALETPNPSDARKRETDSTKNMKRTHQKTGRWKSTHATSITPSLNADESDAEPSKMLNPYDLQIRESKKRAKRHA